jgi:site-specific DNA recombinase
MRVAIYARYSSDNQRDASIADQPRICQFPARQGWTVVQEFTDDAISGATLQVRPCGTWCLPTDPLKALFQ